MLGLTQLGAVHTAISLVAVGAGVIAFFRDGRISAKTRLGQTYVVTTLITVLTGFGIFQHGGFGKAHALGVLTLIVLAIAAVAGRRLLFGRAAPYVEMVAYSATFFFHMIPGITETSTRLPLGAPLLSSPDAPELQVATAAMFVVFLVGAALQVRRMRRSSIGRLA